MTVLDICFAMISLALILAFIRMARGPSVADRVVALDLIGILSVGIIILYDVATSLPVFLDAAIVLALVGFAGTIAFAKYIERSVRR
ncbi:MAG TPA: monovalent cation/H+ antiporter complex subunit F [Thermoanaerobaculia bacterium]|nr:monovalent cation/H+ antiporter complex subunit F [Thermoanaerobaculia bacterium]